MHRVLFMGLDAAIAAVFLIPIFLVLNRKYIHSNARTFWYCVFAVYLSGVFAVAGLPDITYIRFVPNINLKPFAYMFSDFTNSFLNVLLFVPLGFFLPVFWAKFKNPLRTVFFGFCTSLLIELLQIFTFRATDINDLMTNTLGALLGWCAGWLVVHFAPGISLKEKSKDLYIICIVSFGVMFFLQPFAADLIRNLLF